ncbi:2,3-bisphosphoglycerate-independent phosphoglycerate mutase [Tanacetum coccineum]
MRLIVSFHITLMSAADVTFKAASFKSSLISSSQQSHYKTHNYLCIPNSAKPSSLGALVPVAIGGLGLSAGVRFHKDVPSGGLANVAANVMNLHGFVAPEDYETTLMEVSLSGTPKEAITLSEVPSAAEERHMSSVLSIY